MAKLKVEFTRDERALLARLVEHALEEARVEVHRTHTPNFREEVQQEEELLRGIFKKLQAPALAAK